MKYIVIIVLIIGLIFTSCKQSAPKAVKTDKQTETINNSEGLQDKEEIQQLIRQVLRWSESNESINLLPVLTDDKDSIYIGFDMDKHKSNLDKLRETNFFTSEFIENYNQIILTIDQGLRTGKYEKWLVGDLPTFIFANDVNPWCLCQDNLSWESVEVEIVQLNPDEGELEWNWGKLGSDIDPSWKEFSYQFKVKKENNKWKILYLQGFDFKESTRADGQLY
jgi:hypothetical protein